MVSTLPTTSILDTSTPVWTPVATSAEWNVCVSQVRAHARICNRARVYYVRNTHACGINRLRYYTKQITRCGNHGAKNVAKSCDIETHTSHILLSIEWVFVLLLRTVEQWIFILQKKIQWW